MKQKKSFDESIQSAIAEHVQPLKQEISMERTERVQQYEETQTQFTELQIQVAALQRNGGGGVVVVARTDEVVNQK